MRRYSNENQHSDQSEDESNDNNNPNNNNNNISHNTSKSPSPFRHSNIPKESQSNPLKRKLFIRNLSYSTKEPQIEQFFSKYGPVTNCFILQRDGRSKGCGFIEFETEETAQLVLQLNEDDLELDGRKIGVSPAEEKKERHNYRERSREKGRNDKYGHYNKIEKTKVVFVGNLSFDSTQQSIEEFFGDCGKIESVRIAMNSDGKMKGFCHIAFEEEEAAEKAVEKNGRELDGRLIKVDKAVPRGEGRDFRRGNRGRFGRGRDYRRNYDDERD